MSKRTMCVSSVASAFTKAPKSQRNSTCGCNQTITDLVSNKKRPYLLRALFQQWEKIMTQEIKFKCTKLKIKYNTYSSFSCGGEWVSQWTIQIFDLKVFWFDSFTVN